MKAEEFDFLELNSRWVKRGIYCLLCTATVRHNYIGNYIYIYIYMDISNWEWPTIWFKKEGSDFKINLQHNYSIVLRITITSILIMGGHMSLSLPNFITYPKPMTFFARFQASGHPQYKKTNKFTLIGSIPVCYINQYTKIIVLQEVFQLVLVFIGEQSESSVGKWLKKFVLPRNLYLV